MKFRIIALGKDFEESNRISLLCQQIDKDELGFQTLGRQFQWEILKGSLTDEVKSKLQDCRDNATILERNFTIQEVTRTNPTTGELVTKYIAA